MSELNEIIREVKDNKFAERLWNALHNTYFRGDGGFDDMKKWANENGLTFSEEQFIDRQNKKRLRLRFRML